MMPRMQLCSRASHDAVRGDYRMACPLCWMDAWHEAASELILARLEGSYRDEPWVDEAEFRTISVPLASGPEKDHENGTTFPREWYRTGEGDAQQSTDKGG